MRKTNERADLSNVVFAKNNNIFLEKILNSPFLFSQLFIY